MRLPPIDQYQSTASQFTLPALLCSVCLTLLVPLSAVADIEGLQQRASEGDGAASHALAERYLHGEGVARDDDRAAYWYRKAAEQGYFDPGGESVSDRRMTAQRVISPPLEPLPDDSDAVPVAEPGSAADDVVTEIPEEAVPVTTEPADPAPATAPGEIPEADHAASEAQVAAARQAIEADDFERALQLLYPEAVRGNPEAQTLLGDLYMQGLGVQQSHERAMLWYRRAARKDHARAQFNLGNLYLLGEGVLQDDDAAEHWLALAAEQGHAGARNNLMNLQRSRETRISPLATRPPPPILEIQEEVVTAIETESEPVQREREAAPEIVTTAETAPATPAVTRGRVVTPPIESLPPIEPIAETETEVDQLDSPAAEVVAVAEPPRVEPPPTPVDESEHGPPDGADAQTLYEQGQALALGDGVRRDPAAAIEYYRQAAELGYAPAQYRLGAAYHYGEGIARDTATAAVWYRRAAEQGFTMAQRNLGNLYLRGEGVEQDKVQALAWLSLVALRGSEIDRQQQAQLAASLSEEELERARELASEYGRL